MLRAVKRKFGIQKYMNMSPKAYRKNLRRPMGDETLERSHDRLVLLLVEGGDQRYGDERRGPHAVGRVHEESAADASKTVADQVGTEADADLVREGAGIFHIEELGQELRPHDQGW